MGKIVKKNNCKYQLFISLFPYALCKKQGYIPVWCPPINCPVEHVIDTNKEKKERNKMTREQIEKQYSKLVSEIEEEKMYDGRGTVDRYICDTCGHMTHTTYKDKGVTPFVMRCPKCGGDMIHKRTFKKDTVPDWVEVKNWYRPSLEEVLNMNEETTEHILDGGLILEK